MKIFNVLSLLLFICMMPLNGKDFRVRKNTAKTENNQMATKGKLLFKDDFRTPAEYTDDLQTISEGWSVKTSHAEWKHTKNGVQSIWKEGHMPVLTYQGSFQDVIIEVDFRYLQEEGKWAACRISATNPVLNPRAYAVSVWANQDNKARSTGMVLEHDEWKPGVITTIDNKPAVFKPGKWYTLRLTIVGNTAQATCNGITVYGTHEKFGLPKTAIYLGVGTCTHELKKLRVYKAIPNQTFLEK